MDFFSIHFSITFRSYDSLSVGIMGKFNILNEWLDISAHFTYFTNAISWIHFYNDECESKVFILLNATAYLLLLLLSFHFIFAICWVVNLIINWHSCGSDANDSKISYMKEELFIWHFRCQSEFDYVNYFGGFEWLFFIWKDCILKYKLSFFALF
jgi:hypothetical protein